MSRRPDPARLRVARHAAIRNRLIDGDRLLPEQADQWISAWAQRVGEPESADEFDAAYEWIVSEIAGGQHTPDAGRLAVTTQTTRGAGGL